MFTKRPAQVKVQVKNGVGVIKTFTFDNDGSDELTIDVSLEPKLPDRSPLHQKALNMEDLKPNLTVERHNIHGRSHTKTGIIIGVPFKRGTKYGDCGGQAHAWMVPVVTTNYAGKLVQEDWFLADMGVAPYVSPDGTSGHWNDQNYTLAAG